MKTPKHLFALCLIIMLAFTFISCSRKTSETADETSDEATPKKTVRQTAAPLTDFDPGVLALLQSETGSKPERAKGMTEDGEEIPVNAYVVDVPHKQVDSMLMKLRPRMKEKGYMAYIWSNSLGLEGTPSDKIAVIKGTDQYEILRMKQTNGANYDIDNAKLIARLQEWEKKYPFEILGADYDWVDIRFKEAPGNLSNFAKEVYEFCPDSVDQGMGDMKGLENEIKTKKRLFLWWD